MKALADENFPRAAAEELRRRGWDVLCVQDAAPAAADIDVAAMALRESRTLLTFDKDFGEIWRRGPAASPTIVLFRLPRLSAIEVVDRIVGALTSAAEWGEGFWVVDSERVRASGPP